MIKKINKCDLNLNKEIWIKLKNGRVYFEKYDDLLFLNLINQKNIKIHHKKITINWLEIEKWKLMER